MSLQELHINNFKFFREVDPDSPLLKINGRHVLIYGENGSGKSTIYWALYTLLESASKSEREIREYFRKNSRKSLVNIHATGSNDTSIKVRLIDQAGAEKLFKVSRKTRDLGIVGDSDVIESNMASDFINYRMLQQLHNVKHSNENELFYWFQDEVLPYVKKGGIACLREYEEIESPDTFTDINGDDIYPYAKLAKHPDPGMQQHYQDYRDHKEKVNKWNEWLGSFLETTFNEANRILKDELHYNFEIGFEFFKARYHLSNTYEEYFFSPPRIFLEITEYDGILNPNIKKPHTFLNEAKWSAIGLAIRFAILNARLDPADLKCLIIDDMLLSLDMSNRDVLSKLILNKYADEYQVVLMTHDISYFTWFKHELQSLGLLNNDHWLALEMYVDDTGITEKPVILESETELAIAIKHFKNHDYAASANYLRKCAEGILCDWLPEYCWKDPDKPDHTKNKMALQNIIEAGIKFLDRIYQPSTLYKELKKYVSILLNPLSHVDVGVERYKVEIESIIKLLEDISAFHDSIEYKPLLAGGELLLLQIVKPSTNQTYTYEFVLRDSLFEVTTAGSTRLSKCRVDLLLFYPVESNNSVDIDQVKQFDYVKKEMSVAYSDICDNEVEFIPQADIRPFLFDKNGNAI